MHGISAGDKETGCVSFLYQPINEVFTIFLAHGDRLVAASCSIREGLLIGLRFSSVAGEHPGTQLQQLHKKFRRISVHDHLSFLRSATWSRDRFALASPSHRRCGSAFTRTLITSRPRIRATINRATACCVG